MGGYVGRPSSRPEPTRGPPATSSAMTADEYLKQIGHVPRNPRFIYTSGTSSELWVASGWITISDSMYLPRIDLLGLDMNLWPFVPTVRIGTPAIRPEVPATPNNFLPLGEVFIDSYTSKLIPDNRITEYY